MVHQFLNICHIFSLSVNIKLCVEKKFAVLNMLNIFSIKSTEKSIQQTINKQTIRNQKRNENLLDFFLFFFFFLENGNQKWLTFRCIHPCAHTIEPNSLQLKIWRVDKMMRSPMAVAFVTILQLDHLMTSTLYAQHKLDANNIHCLNNRSFHLWVCVCVYGVRANMKLNEIITVNWKLKISIEFTCQKSTNINLIYS